MSQKTKHIISLNISRSQTYPAVYILLLLIISALGTSCSRTHTAPPRMLELEGDLRVHDPAIIKEADTYYLFSTGGRPWSGHIPIRCSPDLHKWTLCGHVFNTLPQWTTQEIPGTRGIWAPDISYYNGLFHLYYSISTFGKNNSAIGLATNKTLDPNSPDYEWVDHGLVVRSRAGTDDFNAIDGNLVIEDEQNVWLCWGSFWSGIKMKRIDPSTGKCFSSDTTLYSLASRPRHGEHQTPPVEGAIEAPFIIRHGDFWYLFVSFDLCCRGVDSTYNIVVGHSRKITGPYVDKAGTPMLEGGGSILLEATTPNWRGPGHPAVLKEPDGDFLLCHAYHGQTGRSYLQISTIVWKNGWPKVAELP